MRKRKAQRWNVHPCLLCWIISHCDFSEEWTKGQSHRDLACRGRLEIYNFNHCQQGWLSSPKPRRGSKLGLFEWKSPHLMAALLTLKPITEGITSDSTKADSATKAIPKVTYPGMKSWPATTRRQTTTRQGKTIAYLSSSTISVVFFLWLSELMVDLWVLPV
jgi:hypothetical protein